MKTPLAPACLLVSSLLLIGLAPAPVAASAIRAAAPPHTASKSEPDPPSLRISGVKRVEGNDGYTKARFRVTASQRDDASVGFRTVAGSAEPGSDYVAKSGRLSFTPHRGTRTIVIKIVGDEVVEGSEAFTVELFHPKKATLKRSSAKATITDDDEPTSDLPTVSVADVTVTEGLGGVTSAAFTVSLSAPSAASVTVQYATGDGSATSPADFQAVSGTLTFDPGETVQQVAVPVVGDTVVEANETFAMTLLSATGASIADGVGIGTITDDDVPSLVIANATVTESSAGSVTAVFNVTLSTPSSQAVTVNYATVDGSATAPADYQATSGSVTFDPGQTVRQILVTVAQDALIEVAETYSVNLSGPVNATLADATALGTINDNNTVSITVANATVTEGNSGTVNAVFGVTLSMASTQVVTVSYATADGSATDPADYLATTGTLTFNPGQTAQQIIVPVVGDVVIETTEVFSLNLSNPVNASLADPAAQGTITDNDTVSLSIANVTVTEGNSGTSNAVFNVTLSAASGSTITVDFVTANGSATSPADYLAVSGTLTFAPGEVSKQIVVSVVGETVVETNETFSVNLSNPVNATISGSGFGLGTINNND
jgi:chitinase